jgi:serine/threonine protein kinase
MSIPQHQETYSPALPVGYVLNDYLVDRVLGVGSYGITYLAHDTNLHQKVAIKEFFPASLAARNHETGTVGIKSPTYQAEFVWGKARYTEEAQTLARFTHPNIVRVYRYFEENSTSYLVMAYEDGRSLEDALNANENWSQERILELMIPLLAGLAEVHKEGFLHRDIKPDNILIRDRDSSPVLIDFGSARSMISNHTMTAMVSPGYGPVEQYSSNYEDQGPWSDIYSMAAVAYRIITGHVPIPAPNRVKKDGLLPASFAGAGRCSKAFLSAIDVGLSVKEDDRPTDVSTWIALLTKPETLPVEASTTAVETIPYEPASVFCESFGSEANQHHEAINSENDLADSEQTPHHAIENNKPVVDAASPYELNLSESGSKYGGISSDVLSRVLKSVAYSILLVCVAGVIWVLTSDKAFLNMGYYLYTSALKSNNSSLTYAFVCPSYFHSAMTHDDLIYDADLPKWAEDVIVNSPGAANITNMVSVDWAPPVVRKQTWSKSGVFWCRDALADFKERKAKAKGEIDPSKAIIKKRK